MHRAGAASDHPTAPSFGLRAVPDPTDATDSPPPIVRRIRPDEGDLLRRVRLDAIADAPGAFTTRLDTATARPAEAWDRVAATHASADDQATWFAEATEIDDGAVGAVTAGMVSAFRTDDGAVTMTSLWSAPGFRRSGVADALVAAVRTWAHEAGAVELRQWLVERNAHARAFHDSLGFVPTGVERPYEPAPDLREVELRLPLT